MAGVEVTDDAQPPQGWVKWTVPTREYLYLKAEGDYSQAFAAGLAYIQANGLKLAGAVFDFQCPAENGQLYLFFPVK